MTLGRSANRLLSAERAEKQLETTFFKCISRELVHGRTTEGLDLTHAQFVSTLSNSKKISSKLRCAIIICMVCLRKILSILGVEVFDENSTRRKRRKFRLRLSISSRKQLLKVCLKRR